jgi:peptide chain release factor subunit 1
MLTNQELDGLLSFKAVSPVISVYLNTDPAEGNVENHRLKLRSLLKKLEQSDDVNAITHYFEHEHDWSGKSVAVFSCAPENFFQAYTVDVPIRSRLRVNHRPHVKPLVNVLDSYGGYGVVLIDKQRARLFSYHLGKLKEQDGIEGESVRRTKRGGGSQSAGRRGGIAGQTDYVDELAERNMKDAVNFATSFFVNNNVRRICVGGTEDNVAMFCSQLPKAWQSLVVGTFPMSMNASHKEVLDRALEIGRKAEHRREVNLASSIVTSAAKGRGGEIGLETTLNAVREGRVMILLIREGYRSRGYRCTSCEYITAEPLEICPFCGGDVEHIPDVVELAVRRVLQSGGDVEVLNPDLQVEGFDQIGAQLRY